MVYGLFNNEGYLIDFMRQGMDFVDVDDDRFTERVDAYNDQPRESWHEIHEDDVPLLIAGDSPSLAFVRDPATGRAVPEPVTEEEAVDAVSEKYEAQIAELKDAMTAAMLIGDDELVSELREDYASLMEDYQAELDGIAVQ